MFLKGGKLSQTSIESTMRAKFSLADQDFQIPLSSTVTVTKNDALLSQSSQTMNEASRNHGDAGLKAEDRIGRRLSRFEVS